MTYLAETISGYADSLMLQWGVMLYDLHTFAEIIKQIGVAQ